MKSEAKPKKWEDRLPLDNIRGIRLLAAAFYHAESLHAERLRKSYDEGHHVIMARFSAQCDEKIHEQGAIAVSRAESEVKWWRGVLAELEASDTEIEAGLNAVMADFIFDPADLWQHKRLVLFVVDEHREGWSPVEKEVPICCNSVLWPSADLTEIFMRYYQWHIDPAHVKWPFNIEFGRDIGHILWVNYLAPYCEEPRGRGHPPGRRWHDGRYAAASNAWSIIHEAAKNGEWLSSAEAVRLSVSSFKYLRLSDPEPPPREAEGYIRASTWDQAHKAVYKILAKLIAAESPWPDGGAP